MAKKALINGDFIVKANYDYPQDNYASDYSDFYTSALIKNEQSKANPNLKKKYEPTTYNGKSATYDYEKFKEFDYVLNASGEAIIEKIETDTYKILKPFGAKVLGLPQDTIEYETNSDEIFLETKEVNIELSYKRYLKEYHKAKLNDKTTLEYIFENYIRERSNGTASNAGNLHWYNIDFKSVKSLIKNINYSYNRDFLGVNAKSPSCNFYNDFSEYFGIEKKFFPFGRPCFSLTYKGNLIYQNGVEIKELIDLNTEKITFKDRLCIYAYVYMGEFDKTSAIEAVLGAKKNFLDEQNNKKNIMPELPKSDTEPPVITDNFKGQDKNNTPSIGDDDILNYVDISLNTDGVNYLPNRLNDYLFGNSTSGDLVFDFTYQTNSNFDNLDDISKNIVREALNSTGYFYKKYGVKNEKGEYFAAVYRFNFVNNKANFYGEAPRNPVGEIPAIFPNFTYTPDTEIKKIEKEIPSYTITITETKQENGLWKSEIELDREFANSFIQNEIYIHEDFNRQFAGYFKCINSQKISVYYSDKICIGKKTIPLRVQEGVRKLTYTIDMKNPTDFNKINSRIAYTTMSANLNASENITASEMYFSKTKPMSVFFSLLDIRNYQYPRITRRINW